MRIREIMTTNPHFVAENDTVMSAAQKMRDINIGALPVKNDDEKLSGIITDRDLTIGVIADGKMPDSVKVADIMTSDPITCGADDPVETAVELMQQQQIRRLVVMDQDKTVGMLSLGDVAVKTPGHETGGETVEEVSRPAKPER